MSIGLICEFNPFHYGHRYIMNKARSAGEPIICVMSGPFIQRGEPACASKYARTRAALNYGADAVVELPVRFAVSAAKNFACGGVQVLKNIKGVTKLAFGVECDPGILFEIASVKRDKSTDEMIKAELGKGVSYPTAVSNVLSGINKAYFDVLKKPNNILALEYLDALNGTDISPMPIMRVGSSYDETELDGQFASATAIRKALTSGNGNLSEYMPNSMAKECKFYDGELLGKLIHYSLLKSNIDELRALPDVEPGLEYALSEAAKLDNFDAVLTRLKSKRYTLARLKRICIYSLLGITKEIMSDITSVKTRVLGIKNDFKPHLADFGSNIITRNSLADESFSADKSVQIDRIAQDIYSLITSSPLNQYYSEPMIIV